MEFEFGVKLTIYVSLTQEDIDDIMVSALEGGITYWADEAVVEGEYLGEYASEQISRGGKLKIHVIEPFDNEDTEWYELDREKFLKGFKRWIEDTDAQYGAVNGDGTVDCGRIDGGCADSIVQYALFDEIVYA